MLAHLAPHTYTLYNGDVHTWCLQDEVTMKDLAAEDTTQDVKGDLFESVPASDTLMRIHSTAEEFEASAEDFLAPFQVNKFTFKSRRC